MHKINGRVNKLTKLVESKDAHHAPHVVDMAHPAEARKQATSSEVSAYGMAAYTTEVVRAEVCQKHMLVLYAVL